MGKLDTVSGHDGGGRGGVGFYPDHEGLYHEGSSGRDGHGLT